MAQLHTLILTDGTNSIDLLSKNAQYGWKLRSASLNFPVFKGGGSWNDPVTSSGRTLSNYTMTNANDLYEITLKAHSADAFNLYLAGMRSLLIKAANYWVSGLVDPVWIEARGINESQTRYAIVKSGILDGESSHWGAPFFQPDCEPVMEFSLAIERSVWRKYIPGEYEAIPTASFYPSESLGPLFLFGKDTFSTEPTPITGVALPIEIDHIYYYNGSTFSSNLVGSPLPYEIIPANPSTGEFLYVGSTIGRFTHLIFDIDPALATVLDTTPPSGNGVWNMWQIDRGASTWDDFVIRTAYDTTRSTLSSGVGNVSGLASLDSTYDWPLDTINGVAAYWLRLPLITATTQAPFVAASQNNWQVYSGHSFVNIPEYEGENSAIGRYELYGDSLSYMQLDVFDGGGPAVMAIYNIMAGFRSESRGSEFVSDISVESDYLPDGIIQADQMPAILEDPQIPGGYATAATIQTNSDRTLMASWIIQGTLSVQYAGVFKIFARVATNIDGSGGLGGSSGKLEVEISMGSIRFPTAVNISPIETVAGNDTIAFPSPLGLNRFVLYEIGVVRIPDTGRYNSQSEITVNIYLRHIVADSDTDTVFLSDIKLIPVDEYSFTVIDNSTIEHVGMGAVINSPTGLAVDMQTRKNLLLDSVTWERDIVRVFDYIDTHNPLVNIPSGGLGKFEDGISGTWQYNSAQKILIPNVTGGGRMFFAFPYGEYPTAIQVKLFANPEYYSLGGYSL